MSSSEEEDESGSEESEGGSSSSGSEEEGEDSDDIVEAPSVKKRVDLRPKQIKNIQRGSSTGKSYVIRWNVVFV